MLNLLLTARSAPIPAGQVGEDGREVADAAGGVLLAGVATAGGTAAPTQVHLVSLRGQVPSCVGRAAVPER